MIHLTLDMDDGSISFYDDSVTPPGDYHGFPKANPIVTQNLSYHLNDDKPGIVTIRGIDLTQMTFTLIDKHENIFKSTMIGTTLTPAEPQLPKCGKHGGILGQDEFCFECFKEATVKRITKRAKRTTKPN